MFVKRFRGWRTWAPYPHSFPFILSYSTCNGSNCTHKQITCSRQQTYLIKSKKKRFCKYFSKLSANNISECLNLMKSMIVSLTIFYCRLQHIKACIDVWMSAGNFACSPSGNFLGFYTSALNPVGIYYRTSCSYRPAALISALLPGL